MNALLDAAVAAWPLLVLVAALFGGVGIEVGVRVGRRFERLDREERAGDNARQVGIEIAAELVSRMRKFVQGIVLWISDGATISGMSPGLGEWTISNRIFGVSLPSRCRAAA